METGRNCMPTSADLFPMSPVVRVNKVSQSERFCLGWCDDPVRLTMKRHTFARLEADVPLFEYPRLVSGTFLRAASACRFFGKVRSRWRPTSRRVRPKFARPSGRTLACP